MKGRKNMSWRHAIFIEFGKKFNLSADSMEEFQESLANQGFFLPEINYDFNPEIPAYQFRIRYSFHVETHDKSLLEEVLTQIARDYTLPISTSSDISDLVSNGNEALFIDKDYDFAMDCYDKAYYWILVAGVYKLRKEFINVATNIIYIHHINGRLPSHIFQLANNMNEIVGSENFYNPVLRYNVHFLYANLLWMMGRCEEAISFWKICVMDLKHANEPELTMAALNNIVDAYSVMGKDVDNDYVTTLRIMHDIVPSGTQKTLLALAINNAVLIQQNAELNQKLFDTIQELKTSDEIIEMAVAEGIELRAENAEMKKKLKSKNFWNNAVMLIHGILVIISPFLPGAKSPLVQLSGKTISHNKFSGDSSMFRLDTTRG